MSCYRHLKYLRSDALTAWTQSIPALSFSSIADARNAIDRLQDCFTAELISGEFERDQNLPNAIEIDNASFTWDSPPPDNVKDKKGKKKDDASGGAHSKPEPAATASEPKEVKEEMLFKLKQIDVKIPRGQLVAIVGAVGSGKTSLLQGLIGDMRRTEGSVRFGGSVAYCSQSAWIQVRSPSSDFGETQIEISKIECYDSRKHLFWSTVRG